MRRVHQEREITTNRLAKPSNRQETPIDGFALACRVIIRKAIQQ
jgi:hypothetical protein